MRAALFYNMPPCCLGVRRSSYAHYGRLLCALAFAVLARGADAQTWNGGGTDNNWSTGSNWTGAAAPANNGTATVAFGGSTRLTPDMDTNWSILSLTFNSGAGAFTLGSTGGFTLTIGINGITNNSTSLETVNNAITLGAAQTWSAALGNLSFNGNIVNGGNLLTISGSSNTSAAGVISGLGGLTKSGAGTLTLIGANTYSGATTVSAGILNIQNATSLGSTTVGTTVSSGATLQLQGGITIGSEALTISGTGVSGQNGALVNVSGTNSYGGLLTLAAATTISSDSGTLNLTNTGTITGAGSALTLTGSGSGSVSSIIGTATGTLTKSGIGAWTLTGANTYTGATTISGGTLQLGNGGTTGSLSTSSAITDSGNFTINRSNAVSQGTDFSGGAISGTGSFMQAGSGTTTLTAANTYTGATTISAGTLQLGNGGTTGSLSTSSAITDNGNFTINRSNAVSQGTDFSGSAISGTGSFTQSGSGTTTLTAANTYSGGTIFNGGTVSISSDANLGASSGSLTFNGGTLMATNNVVGSRAITMSGAGTFNVGFGLTLEESGAVSGNGNLTVTGNGTLILSGSGSNGTGTTSVTNGVLALRGTVSLGSGNLALSGGLLELGSGDFTRSLGTGAGQVNMNSAGGGAGFAAYGADRIVNLGGSGATVTWGSGNFVANGQILYLGTPTADHMVDFQNAINLNGASRTIDVTNGTGTGPAAKISSVISGTGSSGLVISAVGFAPWNPGTLVLSGANTYTGATTVSAGTLNIQNATALGTTASGTTVSSGATLQLQGGITVGAEALTISGTGASGQNGALVNVSGTNNYGGLLTLGAASTISSDSGTLNLTNTGTIVGGNFALTLTGSGNGTISSIIGTSIGSVTKSGSGTWTLSGANTYTGTTTVNGGNLSTGTFTITPTGTVTIASGATYTSTGTLNLNPSTTAAQTFITSAGTLSLRNSSSTLSAPDIYYDPTGNPTLGTGYQVTIATNIDVGTGTRYINGISQRNDYERYGGDLVFSGNLSGSANLTFTGTPNTGSTPGTYQMAYTLSGNNSGFTGGITLTDGANLTLNNANALTSANTVTFTPSSGAVAGLYLYGRSVTIGDLSGTSAGTMNIRNGSLVTDTNSTINPGIVRSNAVLTVQQNTNTTFNGSISDGLNDHGSGDSGTYYTLGLTKSGTGTLTLGGTNTYTGVTTVNAGTLQFAKEVSLYNNSTASWTATNIVVASGATAAFNVGGTGEFTSANIDTLKALGTASGGFKSGSTLGLDTTNASGGNFTYASTIANPNSGNNVLGLTKLGAGTLTLTGSNTYSGTTTINSGTLKLDSAGSTTARLASTSGITINSGGTLLLANSSGTTSIDRINDSATVTVNGGGTFNTAGLSEGTRSTNGSATNGAAGMGALTLANTSSGSHAVIDFTNGNSSSLVFSSLAGASGAFVDIKNWTGSAFTDNGATTNDRLLFATDPGLTAAQLANWQFFNDSGTAFGTGAIEIAYGNLFEICPVPEPGTYAGGILALGAFCWNQRRRLSAVFHPNSK